MPSIALDGPNVAKTRKSIPIRAWATPLTIGSFVLMATTGVLMFFGVREGLGMGVGPDRDAVARFLEVTGHGATHDAKSEECDVCHSDYQPRTAAKMSGATMEASDSIMNFGVSMLNFSQVIFSFGTAPE